MPINFLALEEQPLTGKEAQKKETFFRKEWRKTFDEQYNPGMSIAAIAEICGVSEASIRAYIKEKNIDRGKDSQRVMLEKVSAYIKENPHVSMPSKAAANALDISYNTLKKYYSMLNVQHDDSTGSIRMDPVDIVKTKDKVSMVTRSSIATMFDEKCSCKIVREENEDDILYDIWKRYLNGTPGNDGYSFDLDLTYGEGSHYKRKGRDPRPLEQPRIKVDKKPADEGIISLDGFEENPGAFNDPEKDGAIRSVFIDPPVEPSEDYGAESLENNPSTLFGIADKAVTALPATVVVKATDGYCDGEPLLMSFSVMTKASELGYQLADYYVLESTGRQNREMRFLGKGYSIYLVFIKKFEKRRSK